MTDVVQRTDVRMAQGGGRAGLDLEPLTGTWVSGSARQASDFTGKAARNIWTALASRFRSLLSRYNTTSLQRG
jgi:hypothetical protein